MKEITMYIVVNSDLAMGKGKIAAQVGHGVAAVIRYFERNGRSQRNAYDQWTSGPETTVVLKATEDVLLRLANDYPRNTGCSVFCIPILDAGRTEVDKGSLTVLAFAPLEQIQVPSELRKLKLLT